MKRHKTKLIHNGVVAPHFMKTATGGMKMARRTSITLSALMVNFFDVEYVRLTAVNKRNQLNKID